jgi:hypothetical protein
MDTHKIEQMALVRDTEKVLNFLNGFKTFSERKTIIYQLLETSIELDNLKPAQAILHLFLHKPESLQSMQMDIAFYLVDKNKVHLIEKALLAQLTTVNELLREAMLCNKPHIFDYICDHDDILVIPELTHKLNMLAYITDSFSWVTRCEEKTGYENYQYNETDKEQIIRFCLQKQSIEGLTHLINHHNANLVGTFQEPSKEGNSTKFSDLFTSAPHASNFYNQSAEHQIDFINYLLASGANKSELINHYFKEFCEKDDEPNQTLFNDISLYLVKHQLTTVDEIRNHWVEFLTQDIVESFIAQYEANQLEQNVLLTEKNMKIKI